MQRCKRCTFDSPGLTSESEVYPGLFAISENNAVGVVPFCFPYTILPLIINYITLTIVSSRNSVRVVLLIARGWRGTSLPRVNVRKEIQRHRCWAFSVKACYQWNFLWRINPKKRNTYGVETCISRYDLFRLTTWFNGLSRGNNHYLRRRFK